MSSSKRLTEVFNSSPEILFDDNSKFVLFSDCHRGDNSWADDFAHNQNLFFHALSYYYERGYTYIEIGDGDELWENKHFRNIRQAHSHIFWLMSRFYKGEHESPADPGKPSRLYLIHGNHDMERKDPKRIEETLYKYFDELEGGSKELFKDIKVHEGLILKHNDTGLRIFLVHGFQVDFINDKFWRFSRFFVRHLWKYLQLGGFNDPTSPAKNFKKRNKVSRKIEEWVAESNQVLIAGHTHRSRFPGKGQIPYFNTGSCVHPRCITGIEIQNGEIALIKWHFKVRPDSEIPGEGTLIIRKEELVKSRKLQDIEITNRKHDISKATSAEKILKKP